MPRTFFAAALILATLPLHAQLFDSLHPNPTATKFTPAESATLDRLASLQTLPAGSWRFHAGDLPHAELPSLDDSAWPLVEPKSKAGKEAVWYRRTIEVPKTLNGYDLTGTSIDFRFRADANGPMPEILYFNGRRVAMGDDLEQVQLFADAHPGDKVLVAVKLLPTIDEKRFNSVTMQITFAPMRPNPEELRKELVSAATLLPSLAPGNTADRATLTTAISQIDLAALDSPKPGSQSQFDASLLLARNTLLALRPLLQTATFHLTGNSHIDAAWLWPWTETVDVVKRTFGTAAQLLDEYPTYTYTQSAAAYSQWMADKYPQLNSQIAQRVKEGRWELVGGMWLEPDLNMPDGESLVRQLLIGQATFKTLYGTTTRIGWNPDSFGYNWQLPQIYKRSGIDYFVTQKMHWNDTNQLPLKLFWWESPDGSKVLTYFPSDYTHNELDPTRLSKDFAAIRAGAPGLTDTMDLYGIGDHGGGPTRTVLDEGMHWMEPGKQGPAIMPREEFGTAQPWFTKVEAQIAPTSPTWNYISLAKGDTALPTPAAGQISIPTWKDELYFEYHRGVFTTQADHKRNMRDSEEWLLDSEKLASLAWLDGQPYPARELTAAWKHVLFNQFHDLAAGSGIATIYKEAQKDYDQVRWATTEVADKSLATLAARIDTRTKEGVPVLVFNSLAWPRGGTVEVAIQMPSANTKSITMLDSKDRVVPSQILSTDLATNTFHILLKLDSTNPSAYSFPAPKNTQQFHLVAELNSAPSLGYTVLHAVPGARTFPSDLKSTGTTLENASLRLTIDPKTGCITSLFDKKTSFETLALGACGNELQAFKDTPKEYDAWNVDPGTFDVAPTLLHDVDSVQMVEVGPLRSILRVTRTWQSSKFIQDITLYAGADHVEIANDIDWHETHVLLKAAFLLAATSPQATYEIPYGSITRPTTRNNSIEKAKFEVPAMRWADLGDARHGLSLLNNSKYGYDATGNLLRLTLLRSPTWPDPEADRERHHFSYALYPHPGTWQQALTVRHGYEFNYPLKAMQVAPHTGTLPATHSFASVAESNVVLTAMKRSEDGNSLTLRLYEWAGKSTPITLTIPPGATAATLTNLMEKPEGTPIPITGDRLTLPIAPYQIQTVQITYK